MPQQQLTSDAWQQCLDLSLALLQTGRMLPAGQLALLAPPLQRYATGCAVLCVRNGDPEWFRLGAAALSLQLQIHPNWHDLAPSAAALRFAADQAGIDCREVLAESLHLAEAVRRLLSSTLSADRFGLSIQLTANGLDLLDASGESLSQSLP